jgi:hypothetical protein
MSADPVFEARVDLDRNLLRTHFSGTISAPDMRAAVEQVKTVLPKMRPGFAIMADWTQLEAIDLDCVPYLTEIMDLCGAAKVGLIVRVLPDPEKDIGINILSVVHYRGKVKTLTCDTLEEAERAVK